MSWNPEEAISYYKSQGAPSDQSALISLLKEVQAHAGGSIPLYLLSHIAQAYQIKESLLQALIRRIPSLRLDDKHTLILCAGPNCGKAAALAACAEALCRKNADTVTLQFSPCMRMCGKGPNIKWDGELYHKATEDLLKSLIK